VKFCLIY